MGTTTKEPVATGRLTWWGDSGTDLGPTTAATLSPSPCARWERPLHNDSNHAPAHMMATKSANRRSSGSHLPPTRHALRSKPRASAGRALRLFGLRALPTKPLTLEMLRVDRPSPPRLTPPTYS